MWRKDKYYVLHGMTLNWWFTMYCLVAIIEHDMHLNMSIYSVIQILSASAVTKTPLAELFENSKMSAKEEADEGVQYLLEF